MDHAVDTAPEVARLQIDCWRRMSPAEKLGLVSALTGAAIDLCVTGIRLRRPRVTEEQMRRELCLLMHGPDLTALAWPGPAQSDPDP